MCEHLSQFESCQVFISVTLSKTCALNSVLEGQQFKLLGYPSYVQSRAKVMCWLITAKIATLKSTSHLACLWIKNNARGTCLSQLCYNFQWETDYGVVAYIQHITFARDCTHTSLIVPALSYLPFKCAIQTT